MPELPEVETIRQSLRLGTPEQPSILGRKIINAELLWTRSLAEPEPNEFLRRISGQVVKGVERRGKFLTLPLSEDWLLVHLRMSGDITVGAIGEPHGTHERVMFNLEPGWRMAFIDPRKFGRVWLVSDPQKVLGALGPEPFDEKLDDFRFYQMLHSVNRRLKPTLMDQAFLAGLGNIYTDEALNRARLHPLASTSSIMLEDAGRLLRAIRETLQAAIQRNGTSIDWVYRGGDFQKYLRVYGRKDQACPECGTPIVKIVVGQRGTYYCPFCQVVPEEMRI
ncbi:MAG: DNA-formamidopyrimidine glycosylase [Anaerolineae bacterium UTCFX2]|jgi:formamidopyrimidine-DNA glycosylase|nr:bifunctional DNA-formamidopyrimidine glycosylase/DNA-(apurinic or apyrimidinic site) lyase [Anaerolineales bacterium]OQY88748.1 MAG: DNA-formamidopyrimidine glycosylase [Anaerolineae bacterium UTCFX2]